ncbi:hypothetical protein RMATCC62417_02210 [Rhizopus microsporus]|nr:hypothetical protein RMATCC62417_02210 [Rhizopus microsporus]CEJ01209.1 hypothetical protein RMCBS344292_15244 [Rhizopus microsporus]
MRDTTTHTTAVNALDFNPSQPNLLASAGNQSEVYIWDLYHPHSSYKPGPRSSKMDHIRAIAWNGQVQHILSTASTNGYTIVWDIRNKKEIMALPQHPAVISSIAWHPDIATQIVTAAHDGTISLWDLRHAHAPEKVMKSQNSVFDLSWCKQDSNLLLSGGKEILCWNPNLGELYGKLVESEYSLQVAWCPYHPNIIASSSLAESVDIHPIQSLKLRSPPRWLRRTTTASFGHNGKVAVVLKHKVLVTTVEIDPDIIKRSEQLESATSDLGSVDTFIKDRIRESCDKEDWTILKILFADDAREQFIRHLGFKRDQVIMSHQAPSPHSFFGKMVNPLPIRFLSSPLTDRSIAEYVGLGDFELAVDVCLASERFSDALVIAACHSPELFSRVQKTFIERYAHEHTYLHLLGNIVNRDLDSVVITAALDEWKFILATLCTFAQTGDLARLCELLGDRLMKAQKEKQALTCYMAAGHLAKTFNIWIARLEEKEKCQEEYTIRLQELVEKLTIFRKAIHYQESTSITSQGTYELARLYDTYCDYAQLMAAQGKLDIALKYISLVPEGYNKRVSLVPNMQQEHRDVTSTDHSAASTAVVPETVHPSPLAPPTSASYHTAPRQWRS